ncbi:MAG TPA: PilZ domain-containing protein [Caulobacteraceae bacterium]
MRPRAEPRRRVLLSGVVVHSPSQMTAPCTILDLSLTGARIRLGESELLGEPMFLIVLKNALAFRARVVWRRAEHTGLSFIAYFDLAKPGADDPKILRRLWLSHISYGPSP